METLLMSLVLGFAIGASLGLLGGGGSILTVPALVYLVGQPPQIAVTTSLAIVGANSIMGAYFHQSQGTLNWRVALVFGGVGMILAYFAAGVSAQINPDVLMVAFAALMLIVGSALLLRRTVTAQANIPAHPSAIKVIGGGAVVGLLTGLLGVGGGFLIVPALVMLVGLPMHHAVGTSLVIIAMNSAAGFAGHANHFTLDLPVIAAFVSAGVIGTFAGSRWGKHLDAVLLRKVFALFVIGLALLLLFDNLPRLLS